METKKIKAYLNYLKKKFNNYHGFNVCLGLSCGIDSFVALCILKWLNLFNNIYVYFVDIYSKEDYKYLEIAKEYFKNDNINIEYVNLNNSYDLIIKELKIDNVINQANIKARLRVMCLYDKAKSHQAILANTLNYSEYYIGFFTKNADGIGDINLLNGLIKTDVIAFANYFNVPEEIIKRKPTSGLIDHQFDIDELKLSYEDLDNYLLGYSSIKEKTINLIKHLCQQNMHKIVIVKKFLNKPFRKYKIHYGNNKNR